MIGSWDNSKCVAAILPACLKNGDDPAAFYSGSFPVYRGPQSDNSETSLFVDYSSSDGYDDGAIKCSTVFESVMHFFNSTTNYNPSSSFTVHVRFRNRATFPDNGSIIFEIPGINNGALDLFYVNSPGSTYVNFGLSGYDEPTGTFITTNSLNELVMTEGTRENMVVNEEYDIILIKDGVDNYLFSNSSQYLYGRKINTDTDVSGKSLTSNNVILIGNSIYPTLSPQFNQPCAIDILSFTIYNDALSFDECNTLYSLGADLGGLSGYDNGDGTLNLIDTKSSSSSSSSVSSSSSSLGFSSNSSLSSASSSQSYDAPIAQKTLYSFIYKSYYDNSYVDTDLSKSSFIRQSVTINSYIGQE